MSRKTAKERVKTIHDCLTQNKKIKTISELSKILKISSLVPKMLREKNVLMYNVSGKVVWNANMPYTLEMEEEIYAKTIEYSREGNTRRREEALAEKVRQEALEFYENEIYFKEEDNLEAYCNDVLDEIEEDTAHDAIHDTIHDTAHDVEYKVSFVEHAIISLEISMADLHRKLDKIQLDNEEKRKAFDKVLEILIAKVSELNVDGKIRPRVKLTPTPSTNTTRHNFFGEDL
jgi:hypothetical protein